jgi:hypothetical protein
MAIVACDSTNKPEDSQDNDFFPLRVGDKFLYRLSPESYGMNIHLLPEEAEVRVTRKVEKFGKIYYEIKNYFFLNGFENTVYARNENNNVYFLAKDKEVLFYMFDPSLDTMYIVPGLRPDGNWSDGGLRTKLFDYGEDYFIFWSGFTFDLDKYFKFEKGKGLTQIITDSYSGKSRYDLVEVYR